jgi:hypothetical protein
MLKHSAARLVPLGLSERASVDPGPHVGGVSGQLGRLHRIDATPPGERAERAAQLVGGEPPESRAAGGLLNTAGGDVAYGVPRRVRKTTSLS